MKSKMAQTKLLIDTNAYFRMAKVLHPLLGVDFGPPENYCLYALPDVEKEFENSIELQNKFKWFVQKEYKENRKIQVNISKKQQTEILENWKHLNHASKMFDCKDVSITDLRYLAYGLTLNYTVITEDKDMKQLAKEFGIKILTTLDFLQILDSKKFYPEQKYLELKKYLKEIDEYPHSYNKFFKKFKAVK
jgi:predicted nucleic acid-binding protein